jgi:hypothetical protein
VLFHTSQIQGLCFLLLHETDNAKIHELAKALREMVTSNIEETRSKVEYLAKHYPKLNLGGESNAI